MRYNYHCHDCYTTASKELDRDLTIEEYEELVLFETSHSMNPTPEELYEATECPRCHNRNCEKSFHGLNIIGYVRGNGYLDRVGVQRDMNKFKLTQDDPYGQYRVTGEVDELKARIDRAGKHNPKTMYSVPTKEMEKAVEKAVYTPKTTPSEKDN